MTYDMALTPKVVRPSVRAWTKRTYHNTNSPNSPDHDALEDRQLGLVPGPPLGGVRPLSKEEGGGSSSGSGKELEERWRLSYYIIGWRCIGRDSKTGKSYTFYINSSRRIKIRTILYTVQYHIHRLR